MRMPVIFPYTTIARFFSLFCLLGLLSATPMQAAAQPPLELWIHPYLPAPELVRRFTPLTRYLETKGGRKIEIKISTTYREHEQRLSEDRADLAFVGPFGYVQTTKSHGAKTILAMMEGNGKTVFHGIIAVRQDSPLKTIPDLVGKSFAFADRESTMGTLVPQNMLRAAGVEISRLSRYSFLASHNDVALAVLGGFYDAGSLKEEVFLEYAPRGLRVLAKSPPIPEHLFLAGKHLPTPLVTALRKALLQLKDPAILTPIQKSATGMAPATDRDYDIVRRLYQINANSDPLPGK